MARGHAEALLPLIARVVEPPRHRIFRARSHCRHGRSRQFHRTARRCLRGARHRAGGGQARGRRHDAARVREPLCRRPTSTHGAGRHRCAARSCLFPAVRRSRRSARQSADHFHRTTVADAAPSGRVHIVGNAAKIDRCGLAGRPTAPIVTQTDAPDIAWVAQTWRAQRTGARTAQSRSICARRTPSRRQPTSLIRPFMSWLAPVARRRRRSLSEASVRDAAALARAACRIVPPRLVGWRIRTPSG